MKKILLLLLVAVIAVGGYAAYEIRQPYKGFSEPVMIDFPLGTSSGKMAAMLAEHGVIRNSWVFLAARIFQRGQRLQAGEYRFANEASALDVFGRIARGDIYYMELLIPEGFNMFDVAAAVEKLGTMSAKTFLIAAKDPSMIRDLDPKAQSLEGYLFPNTYRVYRKTSAREICLMMTKEFRTQWKTMAAAGDADLHDAVTLASLVEREARLPQERTMIASVFQNRLRYNMKLDCDPTTVYAALLEDRYTGVIHQSDLASESPYNTYKHVGLPPGPIANPGLGALHAALTHTVTPFLFFVAKGDGSGGHTFSESLQQHASAVAQYRHVISNH